MPAIHDYKVVPDANGFIATITRDDGQTVPFSDPDFTLWNTSLQTPYVLTATQTQIRALKQLTPTQLGNASPAQLGFILSTILNTLNTGGVV